MTVTIVLATCRGTASEHPDIDYNNGISSEMEAAMSEANHLPDVALLRLHAVIADDVMSHNPVSLGEDLTVHEAVVFLTERRISAAPVINEAGRPVGVISEADILRHDREHAEHLYWLPQKEVDRELTLESGEHLSGNSFEVEVPDVTRVKDIMNPIIYAVRQSTPIFEVVNQLVKRRIHRLFVVDDGGSLVGVITTLDLLGRLGR
jgi:CBS domain-containing protein